MKDIGASASTSGHVGLVGRLVERDGNLRADVIQQRTDQSRRNAVRVCEAGLDIDLLFVECGLESLFALDAQPEVHLRSTALKPHTVHVLFGLVQVRAVHSIGNRCNRRRLEVDNDRREHRRSHTYKKTHPSTHDR